MKGYILAVLLLGAIAPECRLIDRTNEKACARRRQKSVGAKKLASASVRKKKVDAEIQARAAGGSHRRRQRGWRRSRDPARGSRRARHDEWQRGRGGSDQRPHPDDGQSEAGAEERLHAVLHDQAGDLARGADREHRRPRHLHSDRALRPVQHDDRAWPNRTTSISRCSATGSDSSG